MKSLVICCILFFNLNIFCQIQFNVNKAGEIEYSGTVKVDSATARMLYGRIKFFIYDSFDIDKKISIQENELQYEVSLNFNIPLKIKNYSWDCYAVTNMIVLCDENKFFYSIKPEGKVACGYPGVTDFLCGDLLSERPGCVIDQSKWDEGRAFVKSKIEFLIKKLKEYMSTGIRDDWQKDKD